MVAELPMVVVVVVVVVVILVVDAQYNVVCNKLILDVWKRNCLTGHS